MRRRRNGQLGDGTTVDETSPVTVLGGLTLSAVSAGEGAQVPFPCASSSERPR
jgi:hypothetical protein